MKLELRKVNQNKKERKRNRAIFFEIMGLFLLISSSIVFSLLCLYHTQILFLKNNQIFFSILACIALICLFFISVCFIYTNRQTLYKLALSAVIFLLFCLILIYIFQKTGFFEIVKDEESLQSYLQDKGAWMPVVYIILQYLQVVILPIPSIVSTLAGVALFGAFKTVLYSLLGIILGSFTAFYIGRKLGFKAVAWIVGDDNLKKWRKKLKGKDNFILTLMFLLPVFPDDVLCFVSGLSSMSVKYFFVMIIVSRILSITATCYFVEWIPLNTWWGLLIWGVLILFAVGIFTIIYKNLEKIQAWFLSVVRKKDKKKQ